MSARLIHAPFNIPKLLLSQNRTKTCLFRWMLEFWIAGPICLSNKRCRILDALKSRHYQKTAKHIVLSSCSWPPNFTAWMIPVLFAAAGYGILGVSLKARMDERWTTAKLLLDASWTQVLIMKNCVQTWNMVISPSNSWILLDSNTKHQTYNFIQFQPIKNKGLHHHQIPRGKLYSTLRFLKNPLDPNGAPTCLAPKMPFGMLLYSYGMEANF